MCGAVAAQLVAAVAVNIDKQRGAAFEAIVSAVEAEAILAPQWFCSGEATKSV